MTFKTALMTVFLGSVSFACLGSAIGATIGTVAPEYYRSVFRDGRSPDFNPLQVGIGLGATKGASSGIAISIVVLAILAWREVRALRDSLNSDVPTIVLPPLVWPDHLLWGVFTAMSVLFIGVAAYILGAIIGQQQLYRSWTDGKLDRLATILQSNDFDGVETSNSSQAQVSLNGLVKDNAARDSLYRKLVTTFGTEEADVMISGVDVAR